MPQQVRNRQYAEFLKLKGVITDIKFPISPPATSDESVIQSCDLARLMFFENAPTIESQNQDALVKWQNLFHETATPLTNLLPPHCNTKLQVRALIKRVFSECGPEVFMLCTLTATFSMLACKNRVEFVAKLRNWWTNVVHPPSLEQLANEFCQANAIAGLLTQDAAEAEISYHGNDVRSWRDPIVPMLVLQHRQEDMHHLYQENSIQAPQLPTFQVMTGAFGGSINAQGPGSGSGSGSGSGVPLGMQATRGPNGPPFSEFDGQASPAHELGVEFPGLSLAKLFVFLQQHKNPVMTVQLTSTISPNQVPCINIRDRKDSNLHAKIILSVPLGQKLIDFMDW